MVNVAIIDDGINEEEIEVDYNWEIDSDFNIVDIPSLNKITHESHGTTCLKIIRKYLIQNNKVRFYSIKTLNSISGSGNVNSFIKALELCLSLDIKVIHLSIGSSYFKDFNIIEEVIKKLTKLGIIIIAALSNEKIITYPACLPCVIGVKTDINLKDDEYIYNSLLDIDNIEVTASSTHLLRSKSGIYISKISNSYATPLITSKVINYLLQKPDLPLDEIKSKLKENAVNKNIIHVKYGSDDIEIPIILFHDFPIAKLHSLLKKLQGKFYDDDYNCGILSHIPYKFMNYDIALINEDLNNINDISLIIKYNPYISEYTIINNDIYYELIVNNLNYDKIYENILKILL